MPEAMTMAELRSSVERIDLEATLGDYEEEVGLIDQALRLTSVDEAKVAIIEVLKALRAVSESGFPVGVEVDLADLVGFKDDA